MSYKVSKRRLFFSADSESWQICNISQNQNDGSIYFSAPHFGEIDWLVPSISTDSSPALLAFKAGAQGKLSLHGSGVTHVRPHDSYGSNEFVIRGAALKDHRGDSLGVRHLFTLFLSEPKHKPASDVGARQTDYKITAPKKQPFVLVCWAVPLGLSISLSWAFHEDDLESVPPEGGWGGFSLMLHGVIWFAYRTKHMDRWPLSTQACYLDGYLVPLLIGTGHGTFRLELRRPQFSLTGTELSIQL